MSLKYSPLKVNTISRQRENAKEEWEKRRTAKDSFLPMMARCIPFFILLLAIIIPIASNIFSYEVTTTKTVDVPKTEHYTEYAGTVSTYVCYTTTYGDCYHAEYCGSLWNSRHKTTVYHAEKAGYYPCSKCTPTQKTTVTLYENKTKTVITQETKTETETKEPVLFVILITVGITILTVIVVQIILHVKEKQASKQLAILNKQWDAIPEEFRNISFLILVVFIAFIKEVTAYYCA